MAQDQDNNGHAISDLPPLASIGEPVKPKRLKLSISYKTEWQKSSERADKLSRWALIGWAVAIGEAVWLIVLTVAE